MIMSMLCRHDISEGGLKDKRHNNNKLQGQSLTRVLCESKLGWNML